MEGRKIEHKFNRNLAELLVLSLKTFGEQPFGLLIEMSRPITTNVISRYFFKSHDRDDLFQIANMVLLESVKEYDVDQGMGFFRFFQMKLQNKMNMIVRRELAEKRTMDTESVSLDELMLEGGDFLEMMAGVTSNPEYMAIVSETFDRYLVELSALEESVFILYINGTSLKEIAKHLGAKEAQVRNALYRCSMKFKNIIDDNLK